MGFPFGLKNPIFDHELAWVLDGFLKGHSQLVHMRIRSHFIAHLHSTEVQSILILTQLIKIIS